MLKLEAVSLSYGAVQALRNVSLHVEEGEIVALLGANGAGKSSLLRAVSGLARISKGRISFTGTRIDRMKPHRIVAAGVSHCPEGRRIFPDLTVRENLDVGAFLVSDPGVRRRNMERVSQRFPILAARSAQKAGTLSGGEQQMLAVGRCLMASPRLIMLDEPSLGLAPRLIDGIFDIVRQINREDGTTIFLVEQNANEALLHADRGYVIENGSLAIEGTAQELLRNSRVIDAYLGS